MKRLLFSISFCTITNLLLAQINSLERFASSVIDFSTQYSATNYSAAQALDKYNVWPLGCGSNALQWEPSIQNGGREFLVYGFDNPQPVNMVRIYETWGPRAIDTVYLRNATDGTWSKIYEGTAVATGGGGGCTNRDPLNIQLLEIKLNATTSYNVDAVRIAIDNGITGWQAIDAVSLLLAPSIPFNWQQYADSVINYSSQFNTSNYSAQQILAKHDAWPACAPTGKKWSPLTEDGGREFIEVWMRFPSRINGFRIFQANSTASAGFGAGAVDTVYIRNATTGQWSLIDQKTAMAVNCQEMLYEKFFTTTSFPVDAIRIAVNTTLPGWQEYDAVCVFSEIPAEGKRTVKSGNWNDNSTWEDGVVPSATDDVYVGSYHELEINENVSCNSLNTLLNAKVNVQPGRTVSVMN
jgi:hypothetical protein